MKRNDSYKFGLNVSNYLNCYNICSFYYFQDRISNQAYCTLNLSCPEKYNKLIRDKNECIEQVRNAEGLIAKAEDYLKE